MEVKGKGVKRGIGEREVKRRRSKLEEEKKWKKEVDEREG